MRSFLKKILLYSTIVMAIFIAYELALLRVPNEYSYKKGYIEQHKNELEVLILGNSHLADCIDASLLEKTAFNAAQPGRSAHYDLELIKEYISQLPKLECFILPFSYDYMYWGHHHETEPNPNFNTFRCMYFKYMGYSYEKCDILYWSEILNSNLDHMARLRDANKPPLSRITLCDSLGLTIDAGLATRKKDWKQLGLPDSTELFLNREDNIKIYSEIASIMRQHHKRLILVAPPIYKTERERVGQQQIDEMNDFVKMMQRINSDIEFYNLIDAPGFGDDDFYNAIHVNNTNGARKITAILNNIINNPPRQALNNNKVIN